MILYHLNKHLNTWFLVNVLHTVLGGCDRMVVEITTTYMQSVPITTEVVSSNPTQTRCTQYNIT